MRRSWWWRLIEADERRMTEDGRRTNYQIPRTKGKGPMTNRKEREILITSYQPPAPSPRSLIPVLLLLAVLLGACASGEAQGLSAPTEIPTSPPTEAEPATEPPVVGVLIAVGDIATCNGKGDDAVAQLVQNLPGDIALLGDNAYEKGSLSQYQHCYDPKWGLLKNRTHPAPGNHEYLTDE